MTATASTPSAFVDLDKIGTYGKITTIESQTYEDPAMLAMNLFETPEENSRTCPTRSGFRTQQIETCTRTTAPWAPAAAISGMISGACRRQARRHAQSFEIFPVPLTESLGTVTGKYPAKDKITSSAVDLLGEESIQRLLHITDTNNPYRFDLRRGALARVAGGGIHFSDEMFKNKKDLVQVYLGVIQNRSIEIDGSNGPSTR